MTCRREMLGGFSLNEQHARPLRRHDACTITLVAETELLYATDAYLREFDAVVQEVDAEGGVILDRTAFYATGGGQPHDLGSLAWEGGAAQVLEVRKRGTAVVHRLASQPPAVGTPIHGEIDWQ